jgi:glycosyltransferase involved in cell wall biosynthesis
MLAIGTLATGGSEKQLTELIVRLPRDRFDPVLLTSVADRAAEHEARVRAAGIPIMGIEPSHGHPLRRWIALGGQYARAVRAARPDVVYAWLDETAAFVAPICRSLGIPCLVARRNLIGSNLERRYPVAGAAVRRAERLATLVTANSSAVAAECVARGHDRARVRIVPNGHEDVPPLPAPAAERVIFGYVAQFRREKGHHRLIDALELMPRGPWRVDLAGEGPLLPEIERRIAEARLGDHVRLVGRIRDIRAFWRDRHVAMLLSDSEGMPNALLESAFAGRPAIGTRTGGTPEVVRDGGILVSLNDPATTVAAMQSLMYDAARRERMAIAAWRHVAAAYSMSAMVEGHVAAIDETRALAKPVFA